MRADVLIRTGQTYIMIFVKRFVATYIGLESDFLLSSVLPFPIAKLPLLLRRTL
jgi:hypothetical protein